MRVPVEGRTLIQVLPSNAFLLNVFYLGYLRSELLRRKGRTLLTIFGLGLGVALVIVITALSRGLDRAQNTALNPLSSIGTDLTVTAQGGGGGAFFNRELTTDLSQLGKAGQHFSRDVFSAGTQTTFAQSQAKGVAALPNVAKIATGLTLTVTHQEGKIPKITATFQTGGQRFNIQGQVKPPSAADLAKMTACLEKYAKSSGSSTTGNNSNGSSSNNGRGTNGGSSSNNGGQLGGGQFAGVDPEILRKCMPASMRQFRRTFTTPRQTLRQNVNTPQTDIKTSSFQIGGVDTSRTDMGLITPAQVTKGRFLEGDKREALVTGAYASSHKLKIGSTLTMNKTKFKVVGLVSAPLGGQSADVYIPLKQLQTLSSQKGQINVVLVRANKSSAVGAVQKEIKKAYPQAQVASSKDIAKQISGSLVSASNLAKSLGLALSIIVVAMAFLLAAVLTLSSIAKRVREIGTLRALGWPRRLVIRQIAGESLAQGIAGGVLGVAIGVIAAVLISAFGPTLSATSPSGTTTTQGAAQFAAFGLGEVAHTATSQVALKAPLGVSIIMIGFALALLGGLLAGATGALRAARLRPADALRQVE
jgi:putative ABC transport system permease protein